jgi:hypothetical protein
MRSSLTVILIAAGYPVGTVVGGTIASLLLSQFARLGHRLRDRSGARRWDCGLYHPCIRAAVLAAA